ncbi:hypothetical protein [Glaesserella parasuis]|uniref:hypothetical protein n=1 Tax=Glaesserella parasuis TaxID=738 RepID=UPI003B684D00
MTKKKKLQTSNHSELLIPHKANTSVQDYSIVRFISNLLTTVNIGGNMSEAGADKAGLQISSGLKFFFQACGIGIAVALALWLLPEALNTLADFIIKLKAN